MRNKFPHQCIPFEPTGLKRYACNAAAHNFYINKGFFWFIWISLKCRIFYFTSYVRAHRSMQKSCIINRFVLWQSGQFSLKFYNHLWIEIKTMYAIKTKECKYRILINRSKFLTCIMKFTFIMFIIKKKSVSCRSGYASLYCIFK